MRVNKMKCLQSENAFCTNSDITKCNIKMLFFCIPQIVKTTIILEATFEKYF